jgi:hypothetical protein
MRFEVPEGPGGLPLEGLEKRPEDPRGIAVLLDRLGKEAVDLEEKGRVRSSSSGQLRERPPRVFPEPSAVHGVTGGEDVKEPDRVRHRERGGAHGERHRDLLRRGEGGDRLEEGHPEPPLAEDLDHLGGEALEDPEAPAHPDGLSAESAGEGALGEPVPPVEIVDDLELLREPRSPRGAQALQALDLCLRARPGLHDDPGPRGAPVPEREVALQAIDEEELSRILDGKERLLEIEPGARTACREELETQGREGDLPDHGEPSRRRGASGRERTWKVG